MRLKEGDEVGYRSSLKDTEYSHTGKVHTVLPDGIPSCRRPLVMIEGKAGVVLESHCQKIGK